MDNLEKAQQLYERAMASAEASHYVQVKAKTLTGMAVLQAKNGNDGGSATLHKQAIALCEHIGATCDLAEAYFQFGLSLSVGHQVLPEAIRCKAADKTHALQQAECFERAKKLFTDIRAPQQIERVSAVV